jgi:hypothetical protein
MGVPCSTNGEERNAYRLLVGKPEGRRPLGRPRCRWVDNIRMDLGKVWWGDVDWIGLAKDRNRWRAVVNSILNLWVSCNAGKLSSDLTSSGLSSSVQLHIVSQLVRLYSVPISVFSLRCLRASLSNTQQYIASFCWTSFNGKCYSFNRLIYNTSFHKTF